MGKNKYPKITVRQKKGSEDSVMTGANTEVLIDGEKVPYVKSFAFRVDAVGVAEVHISMYGHVEIEGIIGQYESIIIPLKPEGK